MSVSIVTDSGCDYMPSEAQRRGIEIVPIWLIIDAKRMRDGVDIDRAQFYSRLRSSKELPTTEPPESSEYESVFARHVAAGNDVVCITLSSQLSKSFENATAAAAKFPGRVFAVDSLGAASGMVLLCDYAVELAAAGTPAAEIAQRLSPAVLKRASFFSVPDVAPLGRSGRMPKALVALGSMLNVSLVLKIDDAGAVGPAGQSRSFERTCEIMVDSLLRSIERSPSARIAVSHVDAADVAASLKKLILEKLGHSPASLSVHDATSTIATHMGAGAVGVFGIVP
jgi:DegV family protein with EDD domain